MKGEMEVALSFINELKTLKGCVPPFTAVGLHTLRRDYEMPDRAVKTNTGEPFEVTEVYLALYQEDCLEMPLDRFREVMEILYHLKIKRVSTLLLFTAGTLREEANNYLELSQLKVNVEKVALAEVAVLLQRAHTVTGEEHTVSSSELTVDFPATERYSQENSGEPITAAINCMKTMLNLVFIQTGMTPFQLMDAVQGATKLTRQEDQCLHKLVLAGVTKQSVLQHLGLNTSWDATGLVIFTEAFNYITNFTVRDIMERLRTQTSMGRYGALTNLREMIMVNREDVLVLQAFVHVQEYLALLGLLDEVRQKMPAMKETVENVLTLPLSTAINDIHSMLLDKYDTLRDPTAGIEGSVYNVNESMLARIDTGADTTVLNSALIQDKDSKLKNWTTVNGQQFQTQTVGKLKGVVKGHQFVTTPEGKKSKDVKRQMDTVAVGSNQATQNLLSPESLIGDTKWEGMMLKFNKDGKGSWLYGTGQVRVPIKRIEGRRGYYLEIFNEECKSITCTGVLSLIRINRAVCKTTIDNSSTSRNGILIKSNKQLTLKTDYIPYLPTHLGIEPAEYEHLQTYCTCKPDVVGGRIGYGSQASTPYTTQLAKEVLEILGCNGDRPDQCAGDLGVVQEDYSVVDGASEVYVEENTPDPGAGDVDRVEEVQITFDGASDRNIVEHTPDECAGDVGVVQAVRSVSDGASERNVNMFEDREDLDDETEDSRGIEVKEAGVDGFDDVENPCGIEEAAGVVYGVEAARSIHEEEDNQRVFDAESDLRGVEEAGVLDGTEDEECRRIMMEMLQSLEPAESLVIPIEQKITRTESLSNQFRLSKTYFERAKHDYRGNDKVTLSDVNEIFLVHEVYNHRNLSQLREMFRIKLPRRYTAFNCACCDAAKLYKVQQPKLYKINGVVGRKCLVGEEWHMDLSFMPQQHSQRHGHIVMTRYDAISREGDAVVLKSKGGTLSGLKVLLARSVKRPRVIKVDRGMEFLGMEFRNYCSDVLQVKLIPSGAYAHGQRGLAERFNRTIKETLLATLLSRNVPLSYWPEALTHVVYVYNHSVHSALQGKTPSEVTLGYKRDTWNIQAVFGCRVKVLRHPDQKHKSLECRHRLGIFLGIDHTSSMGTYRILMLDTQRMQYPSRGVIFENDISGFDNQELAEVHMSGKQSPDGLGEFLRNQSRLGREENQEDNVRENQADKNPSVDAVMMQGMKDVPTKDFEESSQESEVMTQKAVVLNEMQKVDEVANERHRSGRCLRPRSTLKAPANFSREYEQIYETPQLGTLSGSVHCLEASEVSIEDVTPTRTGFLDLRSFWEDELCGTINMLEETEGSSVFSTEKAERYNRRIQELRELVKRDPEREKGQEPPLKEWETVKEALSDENPYKDQILAAMELELLTLYTKGTFEFPHDNMLTYSEKRNKRIGTKWVITSKEEVIKARLVVLGYMQDTTGVELFSPTARKETSRQLYAKAARERTDVRGLDVRNAFIRERNHREVFLFLPYLLRELLDIDLEDVSRVRLLMMLYGMRESPRAFYNGLVAHLERHGYYRSWSDPCHFKGHGVDIAFHVDDAIFTGSAEAMARFEGKMAEYYELKDLGQSAKFTGLRAIYTEQAIYVHQIPYINKLIDMYLDKEVQYQAKAPTPMVAKLRLVKPSEMTSASAAHLPYKELRCSLMWVASGTRPDISYAVSQLGAFDHCYDTTLYKHLLRVLKYLQGTKYKCLRYLRTNGSDEVRQYMSRGGFETFPKTSLSADASSFTKETEYTGRGGYVLMVQGGPVTWSTHKLRGTSMGSYDAEFKNLSKACMDGARVQDSLVEFRLLTTQDRLPVLCDNTTAITTMKRPPGASTKCGHIEKHYYFARDKIKDRMSLKHVHSQFMVADLLTKPLGPIVFKALRDQLVYDIPQSDWSKVEKVVEELDEEDPEQNNYEGYITGDARKRDEKVFNATEEEGECDETSKNATEKQTDLKLGQDAMKLSKAERDGINLHS